MRSQTEIEAAIMTVKLDIEPHMPQNVKLMVGTTVTTLLWVLGRPEGGCVDSLLAEARAEHAERDRRLKR